MKKKLKNLKFNKWWFIYGLNKVNELSFIRRVSFTYFLHQYTTLTTLRIVESGVTVCMCTRYCRAESREPGTNQLVMSCV